MTSNHHFPQPVPTPLCQSFAALLPVLNEPAVDARAAAEARAHAATCAYCQNQLAAYDVLEAALRRHLGPAGTPRLTTEDMMRNLLNEHANEHSDEKAAVSGVSAPPAPLPGAPRRGRSRRVLSGLASLAAVLAIVLLIAVLFASRANHGPASQTGASSPPTAASTPVIAPTDTPGLARGSDTELNAVAMVSPTEGWAVGVKNFSSSEGALLLRDHNGVWSEYANRFQNDLSSVSLLSASDGWAVGDGGLLHYDGRSWQAVDSAMRGCLASMQMLSASDGWAIGCTVDAQNQPEAAIFHYDGSAWTAQPLPQGLHPNVFFGLSMVSPAEGWVVGNTDSAPSSPTGLIAPSSGFGVDTFILHYTGGRWTVQKRFQSANLSSISMSSASDGWAVGQTFINAATSVPFLLHYAGGQWTQAADPLTGSHVDGLDVVHMASAAEGWAASGEDTKTGFSILLHWNGAAWTVSHLPALTDTTNLLITGIFSPSAGEAWAVGFRTSGPQEGLPVGKGYEPTTLPVIAQYTNGAWQVVKSS